MRLLDRGYIVCAYFCCRVPFCEGSPGCTMSWAQLCQIGPFSVCCCVLNRLADNNHASREALNASPGQGLYSLRLFLLQGAFL